MKKLHLIASVSLGLLLASCGSNDVEGITEVAGKPAPVSTEKATARLNPVAMEGQIVGGTKSARGARPYQVYLSIATPRGNFMCGGSIISNEWILTAAHCLADGVDSVEVVAGANNLYRAYEGSEGQIVSASSLRIHPSYNRANVGAGFDIALLKLSRPLKFDQYTQPIKLPNDSVENVLDVAGKTAVVSGWGNTSEGGRSSDDLLEVRIPITPNKSATQRGRCGDLSIPGNTICGNYYQGKDSCQGDSGGPLAEKHNGQFYVLGVVSYGRGCSGDGVYTRVNGYLNWIAQNSGVKADGTTVPTQPTIPTEPVTPNEPNKPTVPPVAAGTVTYNGTLTQQGQIAYAPTKGYEYKAGMTIEGKLSGPTGTDFDLFLQRLSSTGEWVNVKSSQGGTSSEMITYKVYTTATYRWAVKSYKGTGAVTLVETKK